jgi:hypothetical protein
MHAHRFHRSGVALIALTGVFATAAAGALADPQDLRSPDTRDAALTVTTGQDLRSPDTRDAALTATTAQDLRSPDTRDPAVQGALAPEQLPDAGTLRPQPHVVEVSAGGFDWVAAVIGAAGAVGAILLITAAVLLARRHTHRDQPVAIS